MIYSNEKLKTQNAKIKLKVQNFLKNFKFCTVVLHLSLYTLRFTGLALASLLISISLYADIIYLKNGEKLEGEIINTTKEGYEIKVKSGNTPIKKEDIKRIEEKPTDSLKIYSPSEEYQIRLSKIDPKDAGAHFQLGTFCFNNALYEEAANEFHTAKDLDVSYSQRVDKVLKEIEDLKARLNKREGKKEKIKPQFKREVFGSSTSPFNKERFAMFLSTFKDKDKKIEFLRECLLKAKELEKQIDATTKPEERQRNLFSALDFYKQAAFSEEQEITNTANEAIKRLTRGLIEPKKGSLNKPIGRLYSEINEFLSTVSIEEAQGYCEGYLKMAKDTEIEAETLSVDSEEFNLKLRTALNCYLIVYNFTNDPQIKKEVLTSIKRCNKKL